MIQVSPAIERCAQENKLGTFQKTYHECISPLVVVLFVIITIIGICVAPLLIPDLMKFMYTWIAIAFGILLPLLMLWITVHVWRQYEAEKETWLYLYNDGFVYEEQGRIQGYHNTEIRSIDIEEIRHPDAPSGFSYTLFLATGEQLKIKHGEELVSRRAGSATLRHVISA